MNRLTVILHAGLVRLLKIVVWPVLRYFGPVTCVKGATLPKKGGVLIVANHESVADPVVVQYTCARPICFMAKAELFKRPVLSFVIRLFRTFIVEPNTSDIRAIRQAIDLLKAGEVVLVFPEGKINGESGALLGFRKGVGLIARKSGATVIPCAIRHSRRVWAKPSWIPTGRHQMTVIWGKAYRFRVSDDNETIATELRQEVSALLGR
ncbi:MAG: 1-acyl-sn-glycerol-3-phosphate acyltransferase [Candidatus Berkelbacteria bacterium]|nr:MAG: 1-acyl-sn-glycerol-3-phosphate acyltransferase [Candidatus Berkelbacteria bacterium]QQG52053.1 MAG: 1-acyl-sn-glycerol-3-phosphate acyltransferase [Candidatus Berkelbacteria bacterium]